MFCSSLTTAIYTSYFLSVCEVTVVPVPTYVTAAVHHYRSHTSHYEEAVAIETDQNPEFIL